MKRSRKAATATDEAAGFTDDERAAMQDRAKELKAAKRSKGGKAGKDEDAAAMAAKIAELGDADRQLAERLHALVTATVPELAPKLWYGMPAYAKDGRVVLFLQPAHRFKTRYATLGFSDQAKLDDGAVWPTAYAITGWSAADEARIAALIRRAVGR
ncbi:MAG: DUF1801 domain-containing protein [Myxococcota bacterium]